MAKRSTTEDALAQLRTIRNAPEEHDLARELPPFLHHKSNHVIAAAAAIVKRFEGEALAPDLITAFTEILPKAAERDPGCKALIAIAEVLATLGEAAPEAYLTGVQHVQMEGSFGPPVDAAAPLRGLCARGLVRMNHPEALYHVVRLLADGNVPARIGAVRALRDSSSLEAELLLRLKILQRDEDEVMAECFAALLSIAPAKSLPFVAQYLRNHSPDEIEAAALALGEARTPGALPYLIEAWENNLGAAVRRTILVSIAMLRDPQAVDFLVLRLEEDSKPSAARALEALSLYQSDESVRERVRGVLHRRPELQDLQTTFSQQS